jgi:hypothetical protein
MSAKRRHEEDDDYVELAGIILGEATDPEMLAKAARLHATALAMAMHRLGRGLAQSVGEVELATREVERKMLV